MLTHKTHKKTEEQEVLGSAQAPAAAWARPLAKRCDTKCAPPLPQNAISRPHHYPLQNSDAMDVDRGGDVPSQIL